MQEVGGSIPPSSTNPFPAWRRSCTAGFFTSPSSRGLGLRPFTPATGVRIPLGTPYLRKSRPQAGFFLDIGFPTRTRTRSFAQRMGAVRTERSDRRHREAMAPAGPAAGGGAVNRAERQTASRSISACRAGRGRATGNLPGNTTRWPRQVRQNRQPRALPPCGPPALLGSHGRRIRRDWRFETAVFRRWLPN